MKTPAAKFDSSPLQAMPIATRQRLSPSKVVVCTPKNPKQGHDQSDVQQGRSRVLDPADQGGIDLLPGHGLADHAGGDRNQPAADDPNTGPLSSLSPSASRSAVPVCIQLSILKSTKPPLAFK